MKLRKYKIFRIYKLFLNNSALRKRKYVPSLFKSQKFSFDIPWNQSMKNITIEKEIIACPRIESKETFPLSAMRGSRASSRYVI